MRYFLEISYKGTNYSGWQIQENANTVQEEVSNALTTLLKEQTECMGAGRTDAGVHALGMIAHFDSVQSFDKDDFSYKLNALLPTDIAIRSVRQVHLQAHARFDAVSRSYEYRLHNRKEPFMQNDSYFFSPKLNLEEINKALELLKSTTDFESFSKVHTAVNHFDCKIQEARWTSLKYGHSFYIQADRFLRGMVRTMVGTLLDIGTGKITCNELKEILESKDRKRAGRSVPAHGLFFISADYPKDIYI